MPSSTGHTGKKVKSEQARSSAFAFSEQVCLQAQQHLRLYADSTLFQSVTVAQMLTLRKKLDDRLSESLVLEYSLGYSAVDGVADEHVGMKLLTSLRDLQKKVGAAFAVTSCTHAENGPQSKPFELTAAILALHGCGVAVAPEIDQIAIDKSVKHCVDRGDFTSFWVLIVNEGEVSPDSGIAGVTLDLALAFKDDLELKGK